MLGRMWPQAGQFRGAESTNSGSTSTGLRRMSAKLGPESNNMCADSAEFGARSAKLAGVDELCTTSFECASSSLARMWHGS